MMYKADSAHAQRLDQYALGLMPSLSRASVAKLIELGKVSVNGKPQLKPAYRVKHGDIVKLDYDPVAAVAVADIELPVIYQDRDCLVINKPAGVLSHSKGAFNPEPTVASWLKQHVTDLTGDRAGIVHRLDRATSGVMIAAKNEAAEKWLQKQFADRKVKKAYTAVVKGSLGEQQALIDMPIERNPKKPQTFRVGSNGRPSVTGYKVVLSDGANSLVELLPQTGRTHQLRVHMAHLGHPILGDTLYGGPAASRLYLHAHSLELTLPDKTRKVFTVPVPKMFNEIIQG